MGRKSTEKSKQKKLKRKEETAKLAQKLALIETANAQIDPMIHLLPFKKYERNGLNLTVNCHKVSELDKSIIDWAFELTKNNMLRLYEDSEWGWNERQKKDELTHDNSWYMVARDVNSVAKDAVARDTVAKDVVAANKDLGTVGKGGNPVAMVHFRFDIENDEEVLYCYEIQLSPQVRRKGLGKFLMQILELIAFKSQMKKVMLTTFTRNRSAQEFFKKLKYELDECSPEANAYDNEDEQCSYEIYSKPIGPQNLVSKQNSATHCHTSCCHHH